MSSGQSRSPFVRPAKISVLRLVGQQESQVAYVRSVWPGQDGAPRLLEEDERIAPGEQFPRVQPQRRCLLESAAVGDSSGCRAVTVDPVGAAAQDYYPFARNFGNAIQHEGLVSAAAAAGLSGRTQFPSADQQDGVSRMRLPERFEAGQQKIGGTLKGPFITSKFCLTLDSPIVGQSKCAVHRIFVREQAMPAALRERSVARFRCLL